MSSEKFYLLASVLVAIGAINWGLIGLFGLDLVKKTDEYTFKSKKFVNVVYLLVGIAGLYLAVNRDFYLPFLGKAVLPPSVLKDTNKPVDQFCKLVKVDAKDAVKVVYWAADPGNEVGSSPQEAYGEFMNSGVADVQNGEAVLVIHCPQTYKVKKFGIYNKELSKHVHYRLVNKNGMMSEVKTRNLDDVC